MRDGESTPSRRAIVASRSEQLETRRSNCFGKARRLKGQNRSPAAAGKNQCVNFHVRSDVRRLFFTCLQQFPYLFFAAATYRNTRMSLTIPIPKPPGDLPVDPLLALTRTALGLGLGLLVADRIKRPARQATAIALMSPRHACGHSVSGKGGGRLLQSGRFRTRQPQCACAASAAAPVTIPTRTLFRREVARIDQSSQSGSTRDVLAANPQSFDIALRSGRSTVTLRCAWRPTRAVSSASPLPVLEVTRAPD